jgi:hypothetical protein
MEARIQNWDFNRKDNCLFIETGIAQTEGEKGEENEIHHALKSVSSQNYKQQLENNKNSATLKYMILFLLLLLSLFSTVKSLCEKQGGELILPVVIEDNYTVINETIRLYN